MLPDDRLSTSPVLAPFIASAKLPGVSDVVSYSDGPIYIQDPQKGMRYQIWRARLINNRVSLTSATTPEFELFSVRCITSISLAFDQNGRYLILYLTDVGDLRLFWYSPIVGGYTDELLDTVVSSCRMALDDKRASQISVSQVIIGYVKEHNLYFRQQADRYLVPYLLQEGVKGTLIQIGMNAANRFQFLFEQNPFPIYEDPWPAGAI